MTQDECEIRRTVGHRVKELRLAQGLRAVDLAARSGISQSQLSKIETGKAAVSVGVLSGLCRVLDRPLQYLFQREEEIPRVLGTLTTVPGPESRGVDWFAEEVGRRTGGHMSLIPLRATVLGSAADQVGWLRQGVIDLFIEELVYYRHLAPAVDALVVPHAFAGEGHLLAFLESGFFQREVRQPLLRHGIRFLNRRWNWRRGLERALVARRPVTSPEEVRGLRVRIFDSPVLDAFWRELGAEPVVIPWTETRRAWLGGAVDLLPTHKAHLYPLGFCRGGRYVTLLGDVAPALAVAVNENRYATLPPATQASLEDACDAAGDFFSAEVREAEAANEAANLAEHGAVYLRVDLEPWKAAARQAVRSLRAQGRLGGEPWTFLEALGGTG